MALISHREHIEKAIRIFRGNPYASIFYGGPELVIASLARCAGNLDLDATSLGEFNRVADQVNQYLPQA